ncbi:hypothetical protein CN383_00140 [Priestia megaterium]|uniref:hypothetical protein n=1 Tax=Priestia megaterium TaxID=1404 RepID=UPI000BF81955|nr:hypothetical protein [Priestia megaterium]PFB07263.1 hypothetical protein CN383_00140 [Priestia megaterium]
MTKNVVITRKIIAKTNFSPTREFYGVLVDGKDPNIGALPNTLLVDVVEAVLRRLKEVAINNNVEEPFDINVTTPVSLGAPVTAYLSAKYSVEPQFNNVTFS